MFILQTTKIERLTFARKKWRLNQSGVTGRVEYRDMVSRNLTITKSERKIRPYKLGLSHSWAEQRDDAACRLLLTRGGGVRKRFVDFSILRVMTLCRSPVDDHYDNYIVTQRLLLVWHNSCHMFVLVCNFVSRVDASFHAAELTA